ncbi:MAG TPA: M56 family metallopeptidase [Steroidobacteraceae bacterium]|jgi:beta-lactamase regulating signal transducer with metallopeptidase domain|nr:M56 family metallopeptidase [Steroidobacteraceae bacterium]
MSSLLVLGIVLLATFSAADLVLAAFLALAWHALLKRLRLTSTDLLALRLLPVAGSLLIAVTIVLPAFLSYEPHQDREAIGPLLAILAAFALLTLGQGIWRGWRACAAARSLLRRCGATRHSAVENGHRVEVVKGEPITAVIGVWRPRVITAECIISACTREEFRQVVAHEAAHLSARDNLKLLLLLACPDALAWTELGAILSERWRSAAEFAADQRAAGDDPEKRLALASALIKVARLFAASHRARPELTMWVARDDVEGRVRRLLAPAEASSAKIGRALVWSALLLPVAALPLYAVVHEVIEILVRFGR